MPSITKLSAFALLPALGLAAIIDVQVGSGGLRFSPNVITANPGDQYVSLFLSPGKILLASCARPNDGN